MKFRESARLRVPRVLDECRKACRHRLRQLRFAALCERTREQQGARIVVDAVAMRAIRYRMDSMLDHARTIAEREKMPGPHLRYEKALACGDDRINRKRSSRLELFVCRFEDRKITFGGLHPGHRSARRISAFAHGVTEDIVCQQAGDLGAQRFGIAKWNENAAPITQQFLGMPIKVSI